MSSTARLLDILVLLTYYTIKPISNAYREVSLTWIRLQRPLAEPINVNKTYNEQQQKQNS